MEKIVQGLISSICNKINEFWKVQSLSVNLCFIKYNVPVMNKLYICQYSRIIKKKKEKEKKKNDRPSNPWSKISSVANQTIFILGSKLYSSWNPNNAK